jgi:hypothetical protein
MRTPLWFRFSVLASTALVVGSTAAAASQSDLSSKSPAAIAAVAKADSIARQYVDIAIHATIGKGSLTQDVRLAPTGGIEAFNFPATSATGTIEVVAGSLFVKGNAGFLTVQLNAAPASAAKWANKWISIPRSDANYAILSAGLSTSAGITSLIPTGKLSVKATTTRASVSCVPVTGTVSGTPTTLYVATASPHVIVAVSQSAANTQMTFSQYGKKFDLTAPKGATPFPATGI